MTTRKIFSMMLITIIISATAMAQSSDQSTERRARVIERLMKLRQFGGVQIDTVGGQTDAARPQASDQTDADGAFSPRADADAALTQQGKKIKDPTGSWLLSATGPEGTPFMSIFTYTADGNIVGATQGDVFDGGAASAQHGGWIKTGDRQFSSTFVFIVYLTPDPQELMATVKVRQNLTLDSSGDEWSGPWKADVFDPDGNLLLSGTGTTHARRIAVEPLP